MKLKIIGIRDAGKLQDERVLFEAEGDGNVGRYIVMISRLIGENTISSRVQHPYWFADKEVKSGDLVVLYTKIGQYNSVENNNKSRSHFFYQGLEAPLHASADSCVVLMDTAPWSFSSKRIS